MKPQFVQGLPMSSVGPNDACLTKMLQRVWLAVDLSCGRATRGACDGWVCRQDLTILRLRRA